MFREVMLPQTLFMCGIACFVLAIASEIPPKEGEPRLLTPHKAVPIIGLTLLMLAGVALAL